MNLKTKQFYLKIDKILKLFFTIAFSVCIPVINDAQPFVKKIDRVTLESYLSKTIDIQRFNDLCKPSNGYYPNTSIRMLNPADLVPPSNPGTPDYDNRQLLLNGSVFLAYNDMLRLIANTKPKLIIDAIAQWGVWDWTEYLNRSTQMVKDVKAIDNTIIVEASPNEYLEKVTVDAVGQIPAWVWQAFNLPDEHRNFNLNNITFLDWSTNVNHRHGGVQLINGAPDRVVPDISRIESKMWFYYQGKTYIDMGCEALNFSQVGLMNNGSTDPSNWNIVFNKLRQYADTKSNVRFLLVTGHTSGMRDASGHLAFDFHTSPVRPSELGTNLNTNGGSCDINANSCNWTDGGKIYGISLGGTTPSGWYCSSLPSIVFLDNFGNHGTINQWGTSEGTGLCSSYHFDEITWFALQDKQYRDNWLKYAYYKVKCLDPAVFFCLPVKRDVSYRAEWYPATYMANRSNSTFLPSPTTSGNVIGGLPLRNSIQILAGYDQEDIIKNIFSGGFTSGNNWVHRNFTNEEVSNAPSPAEVYSSLIFVGSDKMYYIGTDSYIHGYVKDYSLAGDWKTVSPTYACQVLASNQTKAASDLVASPDGTKIIYIGVDGYVHGFDINTIWSYTYFDFVKSEMVQQNLKAIGNLIFPQNDRAYYIASETVTGNRKVHGFNRVNSVWTTIGPAYSGFVPANQQQQPAGALTYAPSSDRIYYVGMDGFLYYYKSVNSWQYSYNEVPKTELQNQNLRINPIKIAVWQNRIYYVGKELGSGDFRIHVLIDNNGTWQTGSPTYSASGVNGQPTSSQVKASATSEIAISPDGVNLAYTGNDFRVYYYKGANGEWTFNIPVGTPASIAGVNSLQFFDNNKLFFNSYWQYTLYLLGDRKVHYYNLQQSSCENPSIKTIEPNYVVQKRGVEDENGDNGIENNYNQTSINQFEVSNVDNKKDAIIQDFAIYPNPAKDEINVSIPSFYHNDELHYKLINLIGSILKEGNLQKETKIKLDGMSSGLYIIAIFDQEKKPILNKKISIKSE